MHKSSMLRVPQPGAGRKTFARRHRWLPLLVLLKFD